MVYKNMKLGVLLFTMLLLAPGFSLADLDDMAHLADDTRIISATAGYRWVDTNDNPNRAAEYSFLDDSPTFNLVFKRDQGDRTFSLLGEYNNENDYRLDAAFDYKALFRLSARTERMYHNLDHIPYVNHPEARPAGEATYSDLDQKGIYGRRITIDEVKVRGKLPTYPAHINLEFWRMEKKGDEQLRFVSENCAGSCHMQSTRRKVDRVTEEIKAGFDAHLGPVDIAFLQTLRTFKEKEDHPNDFFDEHSRFFMLGRRSGNYDHDVTADAELSESTFMINLPPSGGFITSASYTIGERENDSNISGVTPTDAETDYQKLAADVTYTPGEKWTFNFRYRMFDLDSDVPAAQTTNGSSTFNNGTIPVRESMNLDRDSYSAYISYRPTHRLTIKGEFERAVEERSDTGTGFHSGSADIAKLVWTLPDKETKDRYRLGFRSRMLEKSALKFNAWYEHVNTDDPSYSSEMSSSDELFLSASYIPSAFWGATGSIDIFDGVNDDRNVYQLSAASELVILHPEREENRQNLALGAWFIPNEIFSADINYGIMHTKIDQDVIFGSEPDPDDPGGLEDYTIVDEDADYEQEVHTVSAGINLRLMEKVNCRLEGYHIRSSAEFSPGFAPRDLDYAGGTFEANPDDLSDISEVDLEQNGIKARIRWQISKMLTAGLEYSYNDYDDKNSSAFDGTAQTVMASLSGVF